MVVQTDSERVRHQPQARARAARLVGRPVVRLATFGGWMERYGADPSASARRRRRPERASATRRARATTSVRRRRAATVAQPVKIDNDLYVRDYAKCILCYKCVEACGTDAQNTFAIAVAGRGFDARISTEFDHAAARLGLRLLRQLHRRLPDRRADVQERARHAPGRHVGRVEADRHRHDLPVLRRRLHARSSTCRTTRSSASPRRSTTTSRSGHLCIKGRFGWQFVQNRPKE